MNNTKGSDLIVSPLENLYDLSEFHHYQNQPIRHWM